MLAEHYQLPLSMFFLKYIVCKPPVTSESFNAAEYSPSIGCVKKCCTFRNNSTSTATLLGLKMCIFTNSNDVQIQPGSLLLILT